MNTASMRQLQKLLGPLQLALLISMSIASARTQDSPARAPQPPHYVIGLSPFLDNSVKDDVYRHIVRLLIEDLALNSSLSLFDAYHLRTITHVDIPDLRAFRSPKTRANQFKDQIHKLKEFLATNHERPATNHLKLDQAIRFPQFTDFVGENLASSQRPLVLLILGNPLYLDPKEPSFSMIDGYFPSDGHLIASREKSVFGIKDRAGALKDIAVHFGYFGDPWVSEVHQEKIARFWTLYLKGQGARLATFCGDLPTVFNAARGATTPESRQRQHEINPAETKIEMLRITRDVGVADWITRESLPNVNQGPPSITVGPMKIGIRWKGNIDLDLYASPKQTAETLFFEHTRSAEGYYFKDHRSSPDREYEFIEFETPVDVWQVEANINFYKGRTPGGPAGEIRIEFDGKIYSGRFSLPASHGNEGRSGPSQEEFWSRIDVPGLLKLTDRNRHAEVSRRPRQQP